MIAASAMVHVLGKVHADVRAIGECSAVDNAVTLAANLPHAARGVAISTVAAGLCEVDALATALLKRAAVERAFALHAHFSIGALRAATSAVRATTLEIEAGSTPAIDLTKRAAETFRARASAKGPATTAVVRIAFEIDAGRIAGRRTIATS
jgi:hypothetical protein